jgi:2-methylisocitrate lyase-like PEP mutase family enzyme
VSNRAVGVACNHDQGRAEATGGELPPRPSGPAAAAIAERLGPYERAAVRGRGLSRSRDHQRRAAWGLGYADGEQTPWIEVVAATERIVRAVRVPVTADIEAGYGNTPEQVGKNIADILGAGAVGFNLEDGTPKPDMPVRPIEDAAARIRAARRAADAVGVPAVINARIDLYLKNVGDAASRFDETVKRAKAYLAAGADCIYPFGFIDMETVARLAKAIEAPINIVARAGTPPVAELERAGVRRVSIASGATLAVMSLIKKIGTELRATGRFDVLEHSMNRPEAQGLFAPRD